MIGVRNHNFSRAALNREFNVFYNAYEDTKRTDNAMAKRTRKEEQTNNVLQNITWNIKDLTIQTPQNPGDELT